MNENNPIRNFIHLVQYYIPSKVLGIIAILLILAALPVIVFFAQKQQEIRQRASSGATVSLSPATIDKTVGQITTFDIMVDPGNNVIGTVKLHITYDASKVSADDKALSLNPDLFPQYTSGPTYTPGNITLEANVGNPTKAITSPTRIGAVTFTANTPTDSTQITFGTQTQLITLSSAATTAPSPTPASTSAAITDAPAPTTAPTPTPTNVLSTTIPATLHITGTVTPTTEITPSTTPLTSPSPTNPAPTDIPTATATPIPTASALPVLNPTTTPGNTDITVTLALQGIGIKDNNSPTRKKRDIKLSLYDSNNKKVAEQVGSVVYTSESGNFSGTIDMGNVNPGSYTVKASSTGHLTKLVQNILNIPQGGGTFTLNSSPTIPAGDANGDNNIDITDYQTLISCFGQKASTSSCKNKDAVDFNDDGVIDGIDYAIFARSLSTRSGD